LARAFVGQVVGLSRLPVDEQRLDLRVLIRPRGRVSAKHAPRGSARCRARAVGG